MLLLLTRLLDSTPFFVVISYSTCVVIGFVVQNNILCVRMVLACVRGALNRYC